MKRRDFIGRCAKTTIVASTAAILPTAGADDKVVGANERIRVGWIGCGFRGNYVATAMRSAKDVEIVAVCDVYEPQVEKARTRLAPTATAYQDFRHVLDRKDIDAVLIATPDHWHAIPTVLACQAGKDVYVEKPLGHNVAEGRAMVTAARRHNRVVQTGTQQRSAAHFPRIREIVQGGELGEVHFVRIWNYSNCYPDGIGREEDSDPPPGLDWDFYLGPAPSVPFNRKRFLGTYRYFWDYAGGVPTDWGTHRFDVMQWIMDVTAPTSVAACGARFALTDAGEIPDVLQATFDYPGFVLSYECTLLNAFGTGGRTPGMKYYRANGPDDRPNGMALYGTNGTLLADRWGFEIMPELKRGHKAAEQDRDSQIHFRMKREDAFTPDSTALHVQNFFNCIRTRKRPIADVELGHQASNVAHLANIAYKTGRKLQWDGKNERFADDPHASSMLRRKSRKPWNLIEGVS
jgi:predicted dehydrogenase